MNLLHEALKKHRQREASDITKPSIQNSRSTERYCDRREDLHEIFFPKRNTIFCILKRYGKRIAITGGLLGLTAWLFCHTSSSDRKDNTFISNLQIGIHSLAKTSLQATSWLRHRMTRSPEISPSQNIQEHLHRIKVQDIQTLGATQAKIRIENKVYLPGAVICDNPYIRFIGVEQQQMTFEDREHRRYQHPIENMLE
jgi:hypothetical protein